MITHKGIRAIHLDAVTIVGSGHEAQAWDAEGNLININFDAVDAWQDPYQYKYDRRQAYPELAEQLDMLWHAIDNGTLDKTSDFYTTLKQVKDTYPKEEL